MGIDHQSKQWQLLPDPNGLPPGSNKGDQLAGLAFNGLDLINRQHWPADLFNLICRHQNPRQRSMTTRHIISKSEQLNFQHINQTFRKIRSLVIELLWVIMEIHIKNIGTNPPNKLPG